MSDPVAPVADGADTGDATATATTDRREALQRARRALRERVTMRPFTPVPAPPHDRPATVVLTLDDGTTIERTCMSAIGSPDRPLPSATLLDDKIAGAVGPTHPDFVPTIHRLIEQPALLQQPWSDLLHALLHDPTKDQD